jgi:hypothetical protein
MKIIITILSSTIIFLGCTESNSNSIGKNSLKRNDSILPNNKNNKVSKINKADSIKDTIYNVGNSILYTIINGFEANEIDKVFAVPIVVFYNNQYIDPPTCEFGANEKKAFNECVKSKNMLLPSVQKGKSLFVLRNGRQISQLKIIGTKKFGYSDWTRFSAELDSKPKSSLLTNNPKIGSYNLTEIKRNPQFKDNKMKFIESADINGDGLVELIYEYEEYEGVSYLIYAYKNNKWVKVYSGGYQGV